MAKAQHETLVRPLLLQTRAGILLNLNNMVALYIKEDKKGPRLLIDMADGSSYLLAEGDLVTQEQIRVLQTLRFDP